MVKTVKKRVEEGKISIRNIRRDAMDELRKMEKNSEVGKDESLDGLDEMQKMTDNHVKQIDEVVSAKEKDIMTV